MLPDHADAHYKIAPLSDRRGAEEQASFHCSQVLFHSDDASRLRLFRKRQTEIAC